MLKRLASVATIVLLAACGPKPGAEGPGGGDKPAEPAPTIADVESVITSSGCAAETDCALVELGQRLCGGPDTYRVYCSTATDATVLAEKVDAYNAWAAAEAARQSNEGMAGICVVAAKPTVSLDGDTCTATGGD